MSSEQLTCAYCGNSFPDSRVNCPHHHIEKLHYACLSVGWDALTHYGDCIVKLDEQMIGHRASCFEGNTAVIFFDRRVTSRRC